MAGKDHVSRWRWLNLIALALCLACGTTKQEQLTTTYSGPNQDQLNLEFVDLSIRYSRHAYIGVVHEVLDDSDCYGQSEDSPCFIRVRILGFLGGEGIPLEDRKIGAEYREIEPKMVTPWPNRAPCRKRLVIVVPNEKYLGTYFKRLLVLDPTAEEAEVLRSLLLKVKGEERSVPVA